MKGLELKLLCMICILILSNSKRVKTSYENLAYLINISLKRDKKENYQFCFFYLVGLKKSKESFIIADSKLKEILKNYEKQFKEICGPMEEAIFK